MAFLLAPTLAAAIVAPMPVDAEADRAACERLSVEYAAAVDGNDPAGLAQLFTPDGVWQLGAAPMTGRKAIEDYLTAFVAKKTATTMHVTSNVRVAMTGPDSAIGTAYVVIYSIEPGAPIGDPRGVGIYRDKFVRTPQGWRFAERILQRVSK